MLKILKILKYIVIGNNNIIINNDFDFFIDSLDNKNPKNEK